MTCYTNYQNKQFNMDMPRTTTLLALLYCRIVPLIAWKDFSKTLVLGAHLEGIDSVTTHAKVHNSVVFITKLLQSILVYFIMPLV